MRDYTYIPINEASSKELAIKFIDLVKILDKNVAISRLYYILINNQILSSVELLGRFNSLENTKTCAD